MMRFPRSAGWVLAGVLAVAAIVRFRTTVPPPPLIAPPAIESRAERDPLPEPVVNLTAVDHSATVVDPLELKNAVPLHVPRLPEEELPKAAAVPPPPGESPAPPVDVEDPAPAEASPVAPGPLVSPVLLRAAWVPYPVSAKKRKVEGQVEVRVKVEEDGTVSTVELVSASPDTSLNRAARESAMTMKFRPASQGGRPVTVWYNYRFDFRLPPS